MNILRAVLLFVWIVIFWVLLGIIAFALLPSRVSTIYVMLLIGSATMFVYVLLTDAANKK